MAGHDMWSKVMRSQGALDAKRGKLFSRLAKENTLAARAGGGSPSTYLRLCSARGAAPFLRECLRAGDVRCGGEAGNKVSAISMEARARGLSADDATFAAPAMDGTQGRRAMQMRSGTTLTPIFTNHDFIQEEVKPARILQPEEAQEAQSSRYHFTPPASEEFLSRMAA